MLYVKSPELKNLGIDAGVVFEQLAEESALRELSGSWHRGIWCYAYSYTLDEVFYIEDAEPHYNSPVGSLLRVAPGRPPQVCKTIELKPLDGPF